MQPITFPLTLTFDNGETKQFNSTKTLNKYRKSFDLRIASYDNRSSYWWNKSTSVIVRDANGRLINHEEMIQNNERNRAAGYQGIPTWFSGKHYGGSHYFRRFQTYRNYREVAKARLDQTEVHLPIGNRVKTGPNVYDDEMVNPRPRCWKSQRKTQFR